MGCNRPVVPIHVEERPSNGSILFMPSSWGVLIWEPVVALEGEKQKKIPSYQARRNDDRGD